MIVDFDGIESGRFMRRYADRYCYLGGGSTTQVTKNETDPQLKALMLQNYSTASGVADTPFQAYTGERVAGFNPTQIAGQAGLLGAANDPTSANGLSQAAGSITGLLGYRPQSVAASPYNATTLSAPTPYTAAQLAGTDLSPYYNPFQKEVIDASISQNQHARDVQGVSDNAAATAAGAFGGSRQGVQRAETTAAYDRNNQQNIAALNSANFAQAQQAAGTDIGARNAAHQFNSTMAYNTGAFNAGAQNVAGQFNSAQNLSAQTTNAGNDITGAGMRLNAGNSLANISDQQLQDALTRAGVISTVGDKQHSQAQDVNDAAYAEFMRQLQYPLQQQSVRNAAIGLLPNDGTQTSTQNKKYGLGDFLMAGISGASKAAAGGAFG